MLRRGNDGKSHSVSLDIRTAETTEKAYMAETVAKYVGDKQILDLRIGCYECDDINSLPPVGDTCPRDYLDANRSIREQNLERLIWHRSIIEAAYCIENGRDDYCDDLTVVSLMFDPKFALYRCVNDLGLRHFYRDMNSTLRAELLRRLNEENPKLDMKELPKIGETENLIVPLKRVKGQSM